MFFIIGWSGNRVFLGNSSCAAKVAGRWLTKIFRKKSGNNHQRPGAVSMRAAAATDPTIKDT
jgi:hypothetical protein